MPVDSTHAHSSYYGPTCKQVIMNNDTQRALVLIDALTRHLQTLQPEQITELRIELGRRFPQRQTLTREDTADPTESSFVLSIYTQYI